MKLNEYDNQSMTHFQTSTVDIILGWDMSVHTEGAVETHGWSCHKLPDARRWTTSYPHQSYMHIVYLSGGLVKCWIFGMCTLMDFQEVVLVCDVLMHNQSCTSRTVTLRQSPLKFQPRTFISKRIELCTVCILMPITRIFKMFPEFMVYEYEGASFPISSRGTNAFYRYFTMGSEIVTYVIPVCQSGRSCK